VRVPYLFYDLQKLLLNYTESSNLQEETKISSNCKISEFHHPDPDPVKAGSNPGSDLDAQLSYSAVANMKQISKGKE
jgi:hypothetical protein